MAKMEVIFTKRPNPSKRAGIFINDPQKIRNDDWFFIAHHGKSVAVGWFFIAHSRKSLDDD